MDVVAWLAGEWGLGEFSHVAAAMAGAAGGHGAAASLAGGTGGGIFDVATACPGGGLVDSAPGVHRTVDADLQGSTGAAELFDCQCCDGAAGPSRMAAVGGQSADQRGRTGASHGGGLAAGGSLAGRQPTRLCLCVRLLRYSFGHAG